MTYEPRYSGQIALYTALVPAWLKCYTDRSDVMSQSPQKVRYSFAQNTANTGVMVKRIPGARYGEQTTAISL
jgi:redox-regulated HSP33 family molecular chaperone